MTTTPPDEGVGLRNPVRGDLPHPPDTRPHRPPSASGTEKTFEQDGRRYTYRHVGWLGHRDGAFYAIGEQPADHEPGGWSPLYLLAFVEDVITPDDGLYRKYDVRRTDGRTIASARYFVLDYAADQAARVALLAYADACEARRPQLAADLRSQLADLAVERMHAGPPDGVAGERVTLSPGERITDPDRAEALGLTVEARRLREARAASPDADALFIHVDEQAGTLNLTQTTGRELAVAVNGGTAQVGDRLRHTISYRTGEVVDAEQARCIPAAGIHVEPHTGCILR